MRRLLAVVLLSLAPLTASAHPGVGIVRDRQGNVFYSDLVHIWRIDPAGRKSIAVRDVHSHELAMDSAGNLYGEDSRYQGGDRYRHRIWKRLPDGRVVDVVPWRDGFWRAYGFTSDAFGAMYWVTCPDRVCTIKRRALNGLVSSVVPDKPFGSQINLIAAGPDASIYLVDGGDLRVITRAGRMETRARGVGSALMGMLPDSGESVLVASYGTRAVLRVNARGTVDTVATTPAPWGPSGVMRAPNGDLWLLEYSTTNEAHVRRVGRDGRSTVY